MSIIDIIVRLRDGASSRLGLIQKSVNRLGNGIKKAFSAAGFLAAGAALRTLHGILVKIRENADLTIISDKQITNIERAASALQDAGKQIKSTIAANVGGEFEVGLATMAQTVANLMKGQNIKEAMANAGREVMGKVEGTIETQADLDAEDARREKDMAHMLRNTGSGPDILAKRAKEKADAMADEAESTVKRIREDEEAHREEMDQKRRSAKGYADMVREHAKYTADLRKQNNANKASMHSANAGILGDAAGTHGLLALDGGARKSARSAMRDEANRKRKLARLTDRATRKLLEGGNLTDAETEALKANSFAGRATNEAKLADQYAKKSAEKLEEIAANTAFLQKSISPGG